jgi:hypothetical protein
MRGKIRVLRIGYLERVQRGGGEYYEIWDYEISSSICVCSNYPRVLDAVRWS